MECVANYKNGGWVACQCLSAYCNKSCLANNYIVPYITDKKVVDRVFADKVFTIIEVSRGSIGNACSFILKSNGRVEGMKGRGENCPRLAISIASTEWS